jgi:hypothetical protein
MPLDVPVALILFNRPRQTARVFEAIAAAQPRELYLIADGPRDLTERAATDSARSVVSRVNWRCDVQTRYADRNLGCRANVSQGIDWLFSQTDSAIILEDDCLPHASFFPYCAELLQRYREDERVAMISGDNFQFGRRMTSDSYYFSYMNHIWGWASWRRAWRGFDASMNEWERLRQTDWLEQHLSFPALARKMRSNFDRVWRSEVDTWDTQWTFACWRANALTALPAVNLVSNIGFGFGATHTHAAASPLANLPTGAIEFPLCHPTEVKRHAAADDASLNRLLELKNL